MRAHEFVAEGQDNTIYQVSRAMLDNNPGRSYLKATEDDILADAARELLRMGMSDIRVRAIMRDPDFAGELIDTLRGPIKPVQEGIFGIDDTIKGKIQNIVSRLSDEYGMWDHKAQTFTPAGLEKLKSVLKNNPKYIKYAVNLTADDYEAEGVAEAKRDACYNKVRSRYKVWPSAYASGALVQCRKKGAANWGTGGMKKK
jgi:hypothetical protein